MALLVGCNMNKTPPIKAAHSPTVTLLLVTKTVEEMITVNNSGLCAKMTCLVLRPYPTLDKDQHSSTLQM